MRDCWMFMILLSCRLSHAIKPQSTCISKDLKLVCVPARDSVAVPCPELTGEDMAFTLLKDEEVISNHTCIQDNNELNCTPRHTRVGVGLRENTGNISVSFILSEVNASSYAVYRCEGIVRYPPPYLKESTVGILVRVEGHQCKLKKDVNVHPKTGEEQKHGLLWIWILGLVLLCIYSLIITIIAAIIWVKWRRVESQSDYMNTKPKAPRGHKKRGVQIHIPHHFRSPVHHLPSHPR